MFDLDLAISIVEAENPSRVVLQFQDAYLEESILIYDFLQSHFRNFGIEFYINADSTWGSAADDISAKHVNGQIILFFGRDMSISHAAVYFIPYSVKVATNDAWVVIKSFLSERENFTIVFYESSYLWLAMKVQFYLDNGKLVHSQLVRENVKCANFQTDKSDEIIGGFCIEKSVLKMNEQNSQILYIGSDSCQLTSICGRFPSHIIAHFDPLEMRIKEVPSRHRLLAERYGRISKVEEANVVGILIHSMSMDAEDTKLLIENIENMICEAGKQFYTFVIGRIDESKLENFPEIDIFCLVSAVSTEILKDKSKWRRPIITPFELQVGLGQRDWESLIRGDFDLKIIPAAAEVASADINVNNDQVERSLIQANERMLSVIEGKGSTYFEERSFRGLQPAVAAVDLNMEIVRGQFGTAISYVHNS